MNKEQAMVLDFHRRFDVSENGHPTIVSPETRILRINLIGEEFDEFKDASFSKDIVQIADSLADLLYVVYGTAVSYGIDLEPIFAEVHRSNMSKGDPEVIRASNGKILK